MKITEVKLGFIGKDDRDYIDDAINAGWLNDIDQQVLRGDYSAIDHGYVQYYENKKEARSASYTLAGNKVLGYIVSKDPRRAIASGVAKLLGCNYYEVLVRSVEGNFFEAMNDATDEIVLVSLRSLTA